MTSQRPEHRGICRHDGHTISSHIQVPRRTIEIGDCPGFDPVTTEHNPDWCNACPDLVGYGAGGDCLACGKPTSDRGHDWTGHGWTNHAFQGPMTAEEQEISDDLAGIFG